MTDAPTFRRTASAALGLLVASMLGAAPAQAAEWWYVNQGQDRVLLVDVASIQAGKGRQDKGLLSYWNSQVIADGAEDGVRMKNSSMLANCAKAEGGWGLIVRYDGNDRQIDVDSLAKPALAAVEPNTLGEAELNFVCASVEDREAAGAFAVTIDPRTFADAVIAAGDEPARAVHDRLAADPATPIVRSVAPDPETFGQRQTAKAGQPLVPPRDYAKGVGIPKAADYPANSSGTVYDVTFEGLKAGEMAFEVRGYDANDLIHPASGQTESFPADLKTVRVRDLVFDIDKVAAGAITYRAKVEKAEAR